MFQIIDDQSPYYVKFYHPDLPAIRKHILDLQIQTNEVFDSRIVKLHRYQFTPKQSHRLIEMLPMLPYVPPFDRNRVALWSTPAQGWRFAHKDHLKGGVGINIPVNISDNLCETNWYTEEEISRCTPRHIYIKYHGQEGGFREAEGFSFDTYKPVKTTVLSNNEFILFNTDIWHSVDNRRSSNSRSIITLRFMNSSDIVFSDIYGALFS